MFSLSKKINFGQEAGANAGISTRYAGTRRQVEGTYVPSFIKVHLAKHIVIASMISEQHIKDLTLAHLEGTDRFVVSVAVRSGNRIRIFIDSDTQVLIEHCIVLSKFIESQLNRDSEDFELNVSSAGLDQPYQLPRQYIKNIGRDVSVLLSDNNKINGTLIAADNEKFSVKEVTKVKKVITETTHTFLYSDIKETKEIIKI